MNAPKLRTLSTRQRKQSIKSMKSPPTGKSHQLRKKNRRKKPHYRSKANRKRKKRLSVMRDFFIALTVVAAGALLFFSLFFKIVTVQGYSMMPTLRDSNTVIMRKTTQVKRFDIVYFQQGKTQQIRRIIGLPGETIDYKEDTLFVNGTMVEEKFIIDAINQSQKNGGQYTKDFSLFETLGKRTIPEGYYLVLADNRSYGSDSRQYGLINQEQLIGILRTVILPINDLQNLS